MGRERVMVVMGLVLSALASGCGQRPSQLCDEFVGNWNGAIERCDIRTTSGELAVYQIGHPEPPHDPVSCENIGRVNNAAELRNTCYPWLRTAPCGDIYFTLTSGGADSMPACAATHFEILVGT